LKHADKRPIGSVILQAPKGVSLIARLFRKRLPTASLGKLSVSFEGDGGKHATSISKEAPFRFVNLKIAGFVGILGNDGVRRWLWLVSPSSARSFLEAYARHRTQFYRNDLHPQIEAITHAANGIRSQDRASRFWNQRWLESRLEWTKPLGAAASWLIRWEGAADRLREDAGLVDAFLRAPLEHKARWNDAFIERMKPVLSNGLTPSQKTAVLTEEDVTLVLAGAGSGKTKVIISRIEYLTQERDVPPGEILVVTFNRDAKNEIIDRLAKQRIRGVEVCTFHGFGRSVLRDSGYDVGKDDEPDQDDDDLDDDLEPEAPDESHRNWQGGPHLSQLAKSEAELERFLFQVLGDLYEHKGFRDALNQFLIEMYSNRVSVKISGARDYYEYLESCDLLSLANHPVRSFEECAISNFLHLNGVEHNYEDDFDKPTSGGGRRQYKPDFHIRSHNIWIEHFAFTDPAETNTPPFIPYQKYKDDADWKRQQHTDKRKFVQTFSWQMSQGTLFAELERQLKDRGVESQPIPFDQIFAKVQDADGRSKFVKLLRRFLCLAKISEYDMATLQRRMHRVGDIDRACRFLGIYGAIRVAYDRRLDLDAQIDFADMITQGRRAIEKGRYTRSFRHILIDEFQDIAPGRAKLVKAIAGRHEDARLLFVGDDWQSINRFAGSDLSILRNMRDEFGYFAELKLDRTFRCNQEIVDVSSQFVTAKGNQTQKLVESQRPVEAESVITDSDKSGQFLALDRAFKEIAQRANGEKTCVLILGRKNLREKNPKDQPALRKIEGLEKTYPNLMITYKTIHRSKGLEARYIVVMGLSGGKSGFPARRGDDPLLNMVLPDDDNVPHAEERRLFYVALTRTMDGIWLLTEEANPSEFVPEIEARNPDIVKMRRVDTPPLKCPGCGVGNVVPWASGKGHRCEFSYFCETWLPNCLECGASSVGLDPSSGKFICASCREPAKICWKCQSAPFSLLKGGRKISCISCGHMADAPKKIDKEGRQTTGVVAKFYGDRGFGFVKPDDGGSDAWFSKTTLNKSGVSNISDGTRVTCFIVPGEKSPEVARFLPADSPPQTRRRS
jgi:DNA helicase-4